MGGRGGGIADLAKNHMNDICSNVYRKCDISVKIVILLVKREQ